MLSKQYLGDSVYAEVENGMIKLTTNNGYEDSNMIYLEWNVYENLERYVGRLRDIHEQMRKAGPTVDPHPRRILDAEED